MTALVLIPRKIWPDYRNACYDIAATIGINQNNSNYYMFYLLNLKGVQQMFLN